MSSSPSRVHKYLTEDLTIRVACVNATSVVEHMRSLQNTYPIATVATGRAMVGALLMASHLKDNQLLSLYFRGNGPLASIFAEASFEGHSRAFVANPQYVSPEELPPGEEVTKVGSAIGIGLLEVTHHLPNNQQPHRGTVIIRTGEIGDDIAFYLHQSHQIPSVVSLGVFVDVYGRVQAAGGVLIEVMPGVTDETLAKLEETVKKAPSVSKRILEGASADELVRDFLKGFNLIEMPHDHPIKYQCRCTEERVLRSVALLGLEELDQVLAEKKPLDVTCEFCGKKYQLGEAAIQKLRNDLYKQSLN